MVLGPAKLLPPLKRLRSREPSSTPSATVVHMAPTAAITGPAKRELPETPNSQYQYLVLANIHIGRWPKRIYSVKIYGFAEYLRGCGFLSLIVLSTLSAGWVWSRYRPCQGKQPRLQRLAFAGPRHPLHTGEQTYSGVTLRLSPITAQCP